MILSIQNIILLATAVLAALIAGLFYSYSCSVIPGLGRLPDKEYLLAMQSINRAILNPIFFLSFLGTLIMLPVCTWICYRQGISPVFICLLAASFIYLAGVLGVTALGNIPLNNRLENFALSGAAPEEIKTLRLEFEIPWNRFNLIRTIASISTLVLAIAACIMTTREPLNK